MPAPQFGASCVRLRMGDPAGLRRVTLANARSAPPRDTPRRVGLPVAEPVFPTKTPAGRRSSISAPVPAPGGQPDPGPRARISSIEQLRWARCPDEGRLHLLAPGDVRRATADGHARAVCGRPVPAAGLTIANGPSMAL